MKNFPLLSRQDASRLNRKASISDAMLDALDKVFKKYKGSKLTKLNVKANGKFTLSGKI